MVGLFWYVWVYAAVVVGMALELSVSVRRFTYE